MVFLLLLVVCVKYWWEIVMFCFIESIFCFYDNIGDNVDVVDRFI